MNVNRRTVTLLVVAVVVVGGVYAITWWQRSRETRRLLEEVESSDHGIATEAMITLRERVPSVQAELLGLMDHTDANVRWRAALLLAESDDARSRERLDQALTDDAASVRAEAALALGKRGVRGSADRIALLAAGDTEPVAVRTAAMRALQMLRTGTHLAEAIAVASDRPPPPPPEDDEAFEDYVDETAPLRLQAVRTAAVLGATIGSGPEAEGSRAKRAVEMLIESADAEEEPNDEVRQAACYALGDLALLVGDEEVQREAVHGLIAGLEDEVGDVRIAAAHSLRLAPVPKTMRESVRMAMRDLANDDHYWVREIAEEAVAGE
jgi:HEAT repeat protein